MRLIINWYNEPNAQRIAELNECLQQNINNPLITQIITVGEESPEHDKVINILRPRPTFTDLFQYSAEGINIIANSDIYFDSSLALAVPKENEVFALTRWDVDKRRMARFFNRADSQDSWIYRNQLNCFADFYLGIAGCDNALAYLLEQAGHKVTNPSKTIKSYHLHLSKVRNYIQKGRVDRVPPPYKVLHPTELKNWTSELSAIKGGKYSQFDEDALIDFIFSKIGTTNKYLVDLGAWAYDGKMSNTKRLIESGWQGYGVDMNDSLDAWIVKQFITPEGILKLMAKKKTPTDFDLLNLDIDSCDFYVLKEILSKYRPRLIVSEFNGCLDPNKSLVLKYEQGYTWDNTDKYGYSFSAGVRLLEKNGYKVIYNQHDTNLFAVRAEDAPPVNVTARRNQYHPHNPDAKFIEYE